MREMFAKRFTPFYAKMMNSGDEFSREHERALTDKSIVNLEPSAQNGRKILVAKRESMPMFLPESYFNNRYIRLLIA